MSIKTAYAAIHVPTFCLQLSQSKFVVNKNWYQPRWTRRCSRRRLVLIKCCFAKCNTVIPFKPCPACLTARCGVFWLSIKYFNIFNQYLFLESFVIFFSSVANIILIFCSIFFAQNTTELGWYHLFTKNTVEDKNVVCRLELSFSCLQQQNSFRHTIFKILRKNSFSRLSDWTAVEFRRKVGALVWSWTTKGIFRD